jgi:hypothetical protein
MRAQRHLAAFAIAAPAVVFCSLTFMSHAQPELGTAEIAGGEGPKEVVGTTLQQPGTNQRLSPPQTERTAPAETAKDDPAKRRLYETIAGLDRMVFDAFNSCDLEKIGQLWTEDLEFYHDRSGLLVSRRSNLEEIRKNLCGAEQSSRLRRELVAGSMEVYPLNHYGAIQMGSHRFYIVADGKKDHLDGVGKFVHVWHQSDGKWQMSRILSYDHHAPERGDEPPAYRELFDKLAGLDRVLFDAFNAGKADAFKMLFTDDAEFYHDQGGLTKSLKGIVESLDQKFRSDKANGEIVKRDLVEGSLKVYPLDHYGAIQTGIHRFHKAAAGPRAQPATIARFIHVWKNTNGEWKLSRAFSYDHTTAKD